MADEKQFQARKGVQISIHLYAKTRQPLCRRGQLRSEGDKTFYQAILFMERQNAGQKQEFQFHCGVDACPKRQRNRTAVAA